MAQILYDVPLEIASDEPRVVIDYRLDRDGIDIMAIKGASRDLSDGEIDLLFDFDSVCDMQEEIGKELCRDCL